MNFPIKHHWNRVVSKLIIPIPEPIQPSEPVWNGQKSQRRIEFAFECGGTNYFYYPNPADASVIRFEVAHRLISVELERGVHRQQLKETAERIVSNMDAILNNKEGGVPIGYLTDTKSIAQSLLDVQTFPLDIDSFYEAAGAIFFDETEDPSNYDPLYAIAKIKFWIEHKLKGFFLRLPLAMWMPHFGNVMAEMLEEQEQNLRLLKQAQKNLLKNE